MSWLERLAALLGVIVALPATWLVIKGWAASIRRRIERDEKLTFIVSQFYENSGHTMRDKLNQLSEKLDQLDERIAARLKTGDSKFGVLEEKIKAVLERCPQCQRMRESEATAAEVE